MKSVLLKDLLKDDLALARELAGTEITVSGWIRSIRDSKALGFMVLHDGSCFPTLQIVYEDGKVNSYMDQN